MISHLNTLWKISNATAEVLMLENTVHLKLQTPQTVKLEQGFPNMYPVAEKTASPNDNIKEISFEFEGTGFKFLRGEAQKLKDDAPDHDFEARAIH